MHVKKQIEGIQSLRERWQYFRLTSGDHRGMTNRRDLVERFGLSREDVPRAGERKVEVFLRLGNGTEVHRFNELSHKLKFRPISIEIREMDWSNRRERVLERLTFSRKPVVILLRNGD